MSIIIVNKHNHISTENDIYIGRGSILGNPYSHLKNSKAEFIVKSRDEAIAKYKIWLISKLKLKDENICRAIAAIYKKSKESNVYLVCYCYPLSCHGEVIKSIVENL